MEANSRERTKLPKWAQAEISKLDQRIRDLETENAVLRGEVTDPFVYTSRAGSVLPIYGSPFVRNVEIGLGEVGDRWSITLTDSNDLEITSPWGRRVSVQPWVTNVIHVVAVK